MCHKQPTSLGSGHEVGRLDPKAWLVCSWGLALIYLEVEDGEEELTRLGFAGSKNECRVNRMTGRLDKVMETSECFRVVVSKSYQLQLFKKVYLLRWLLSTPKTSNKYC